jgi:ankyrin repeat protein
MEEASPSDSDTSETSGTEISSTESITTNDQDKTITKPHKPAASFMWDSATAEEVKAKIASGFDIHHYPSDKEKTWLMIAAEVSRYPDVIKLLIDAGIDVNAKDKEGKTALMYAAESNRNPDILRVLLENGADITARDHEGRTPLIWAAWGILACAGNTDPINPEVFQVLIDAGKGKTVDTHDGKVPLIDAPGYNYHTALVEIIIKDNGGQSAKSLSPQSWEVLKALLQAGANVNFRGDPVCDDCGGYTPLMEAALFTYDPKVIHFLVKNGAKVNSVNDFGQTALMIAAQLPLGGDIVRALLENGADPDMKDENGKTAEDYAREAQQRSEKLRKYLENKADPYTKDIYICGGTTEDDLRDEEQRLGDIIRMLSEKRH